MLVESSYTCQLHYVITSSTMGIREYLKGEGKNSSKAYFLIVHLYCNFLLF